MKNRATATAALTLTAVLALAGCAATAGSGNGMSGMDHGSTSSSPAAPAADANEADTMFASMMIEHHTQAIGMSDMILAKDGIDQRVLDLAAQIKAAQQPEIDVMQSWLDEWGASMSDMDSVDHDMDGMMSEEDMQALEDATGADASRLFLEQMIAHHEGAITMAQDEVRDGQNADAVALAETIIDAQTSEITTMEEILATL